MKNRFKVNLRNGFENQGKILTYLDMYGIPLKKMTEYFAITWKKKKDVLSLHVGFGSRTRGFVALRRLKKNGQERRLILLSILGVPQK